ncbi:MAG: isoprenylcysteine carboxylmethyltransferase family protein [Hyphomicrobiales bacterium]|nr:isoprenylcysteine carboxylmethyltransferase family protein [Hyphomicrobiales bacterium]
MDQPSRIPWPPLIYLGTIVSSYFLGKYYPLPWLPTIISDGLLAVGILMVAGGFAFDIYAIRTLRKHKTTVSPVRKADQLVTSGPFALSRNPIYLGNTVLTFGFGVLFANPWFFIAAIVAAILTNYLQIAPEEKHLAHLFGKQWRSYAKSVRRWI